MSAYFFVISKEDYVLKIYSEDFFYKNLLGFNSREVIEDIVVTANVYQNFTIKVNGKNRDISAINSNTKLYHLQRKLLKNFLNNIPLPNCVCGFVEGKSYLDFLKPHCGKKYYIRLDIKNFFNSIKSINIAKVLDEYIQIENQEQKQQVIKDICKIVTLNDSLPQGAVTSPQLSNIFFRRLDIRIRNYCRKFKVEYTRYADDMLFSSMEESLHQDFFVNKISKIVKDVNLNINKKKVIKSKNKIILNGYVISDKISLSRNKLKKINTFIYSFNKLDGKKKRIASTEEYTYRLAGVKNLEFYLTDKLHINKMHIINFLAGYRSFLMTFSKPNIEDYCIDYSDKVKEIEAILKKLTQEKLSYSSRRYDVAIIIEYVKFGKVNGFNIEVRRTDKVSNKDKIVYKSLKMDSNDMTLFVKFYPHPLSIVQVISDIEKKSPKNWMLMEKTKEINYALNINERKGTFKI